MPNYDAIVISAATINAKCQICDRPLDTDASLNLSYGYKDRSYCPDCLIKIFDGYPKNLKDLNAMAIEFQKLRAEFEKLKEAKSASKTETETKAKTQTKSPESSTSSPDSGS